MAKEILYRIEFEGAEQQLNKLDQIAEELAKIKLLQNGLNADDKKSQQQKQREGEILKAMAAERQQALQRERRALVDQQKQHRATAGTLEDLRLKAKRLGQELERGPVVGSKEFKKLSNELREVNDRIRTADKSAGNFKTSIGNYRDAIGGLGAALGTTLSIGAIVAGGNKVLSLYDAQVKAETALLTALKGREDIQKSLIKQATDLQGKTIFGDEQIIQVQSYAASMGLTRTQIEKLIPAALNLSTVTGMDLQAAVKNLAKTYSGLSGELGEAVPALRGLTAEELKAGKAIELVNTLMAGQAEAAAAVGTGPLVQAKNVWGDFLEILGKVIATNTGGFFRGLTKELQATNTVLSEESIPLYQRLYALINPAAREELRIKTEIINKRRQEIGLSNQERIDALDAVYQNIEEGKKLLALKKQQREEDEKAAKLARENAAKVAADAAAKAIEKQRIEAEKLRDELDKLVPTLGRLIASTDETMKRRKVITLPGLPGIEEEESLPDEIDTAAVVRRLSESYDIDATIEAAGMFADVWGEAYAQREQSLRESLERGLITEQQYQKETEKLQKKQANIQRIVAISQLTADFARTLSALGLGAANTAKVGFPQNIPLLIAFAAQAAGIISNLKGIKFEKGGMINVGGNSHAQGGTKFVGSDGSAFEAERDEVLAIVNKHDSKTLKSLSDINSRHGRSFYGQPSWNYFASGGIYQPNPNIGNSDPGKLVRDIVSQVGNIPVTVSLNEIERKSQLKRKVNVIGSL